MGRRSRVGIVIGALALVATLERGAIAQTMVKFVPRHVVRATTATLSPELRKKIDAQTATTTITKPEDLIAFGLGVTSNALHFGLSHHTRLSFDESEREGNCVEYAELFAATLNREHGAIDAHAWVVRSDAKILGQTMRDPAWKDHDWVLVVVHENAQTRHFYVDPTLYDMGLGWNITPAVQGEVRSL